MSTIKVSIPVVDDAGVLSEVIPPGTVFVGRIAHYKHRLFIKAGWIDPPPAVHHIIALDRSGEEEVFPMYSGPNTKVYGYRPVDITIDVKLIT